MFKKCLIFAFCLLVPLAVTAQNLDAANPKSQHKALVLEVIGLLQEHVITRESVDWHKLTLEALKILGSTPDLEKRNQAIYYALKNTYTNHSFYRFKQSGKVILHSDFNCKISISDDYEIPDDIGYVRVDAFPGSQANEVADFTKSIQSQIQKQDNKKLRGWVVDLRRNSGGNMWPMLAALSPLLEDGVKGYFIKPNGERTKWGTYKGASVLANRFQVKPENAYQLQNRNKPIAVLSSKLTSSSGEAMLIAFRGKENARIIGSDSCGISTANRGFILQNGDTLLVTTSTMADRTGRQYPAGVKVDELSTTPMKSASNWINSKTN